MQSQCIQVVGSGGPEVLVASRIEVGKPKGGQPTRFLRRRHALPHRLGDGSSSLPDRLYRGCKGRQTASLSVPALI